MTDAPITLHLCSECNAQATRAALVRRVQASDLAGTVLLRGQACLNCCDAPLALGVQAPGRASYVFDGVTASDTDSLLTFLRLYLAASDGWITDARPLGDLRTRLRARLLPAATSGRGSD